MPRRSGSASASRPPSAGCGCSEPRAACRPPPKGGDLRSHRIEAFRTVILDAVEAQKDITLAELAALLGQVHGAWFAISTVHRLLARHRIGVTS